jgi:hypothetical protein
MYVLKSVPDDRAGVAGGVLNVVREVSGAFGIAVIGLLIHRIPPADADPAALEEFRSGVASGLLLAAALVLVGSAISATTLPSRSGWTGPKHVRRRGRPAPPPRMWPIWPVGTSWGGLAVTTEGRHVDAEPVYTSPPRYPAYPPAETETVSAQVASGQSAAERATETIDQPPTGAISERPHGLPPPPESRPLPSVRDEPAQ